MKVVAFAYACDPEHGSEPGAGWALARLVAGFADTWVITRANNRPAIERHLADVPERANLHVVYVDLPPWARWWKRGQRGLRLYYTLWQLHALLVARRLHRQIGFTHAWHLTFATAWLGSTAPLLGVPCVFGPVGAGVGTTWPLVPTLGPAGIARDVLHAVVRGTARVANPLARSAWRRSALVLAQNPETRDWFPRRHRSKVAVFPNVVLDPPPTTCGRPGPGEPPTALFAGRLMPHKGPRLAVGAIAQLPGWRLLFCGDGPSRPGLEQLARDLGVAGQVEFLGQLPRDDVLELMCTGADVFVFPSLHDEAPWVVGEALSRGLPVVCLENGGPAYLGGDAVPASTPGRTTRALATAMRHALERGRSAPDHRFTIERRRQELLALLAEFGLLPEPAPAGRGEEAAAVQA